MNMIATASIAGSVPVAAVAMPAPVSHDPIFEAIERHRRAYLVHLESRRVRATTIDHPGSPKYDAAVVRAANARMDSTVGEDHDSAMVLTTLRPTSLAGVLALLAYVDEFNAGLLVNENDGEWKSSMIDWPELKREENDWVDCFPYLILANARHALAAIGERGGFAGIANAAIPSRPADPIYPLIDKHRALVDELERSSDRYGEVEGRYFELREQPNVEATPLRAAKAATNRENKRHNRVADRERLAFDAVWGARPATAAGFDAWLDHLQTMGADQRIGLLLSDGALADFIQKVRYGASL